jgi:hypothetical protein
VSKLAALDYRIIKGASVVRATSNQKPFDATADCSTLLFDPVDRFLANSDDTFVGGLTHFLVGMLRYHLDSFDNFPASAQQFPRLRQNLRVFFKRRHFFAGQRLKYAMLSSGNLYANHGFRHFINRPLLPCI